MKTGSSNKVPQGADSNADQAHSSEPKQHASLQSNRSVTIRAIIVGVLLCALVDVWIEYAELIISGTALVNTAIPVGPFTVLFAVSGLNLLCRAILPGLAFTSGEMLTIYIMMATSTVMASSGQLQFIVPTITAPFHYATADNGWAGQFFRYIPKWLAQTDPTVLDGFYKGRSAIPVAKWAPQIFAWSGFLLALAGASLCITAILRRQWVDREQLSFPTLAVPLAMVQDGVPIFRNKLFWLGAAIPFGVSLINTISLNYPGFPSCNLRANPLFGAIYLPPPWNSISDLQISAYPFAIGIAYFAPLDVSFSCWAFYLLTMVERFVGALLGIDVNNTSGLHAAFPYIPNQGAGAYIALPIISLLLSRKYLSEVWEKAFGSDSKIDDSNEPMGYRTAFVGLFVCVGFMLGFCIVAGMSPIAAIIMLALGLTNFIAATRVRAETGDAWLFGPDNDVNMIMTRTFGAGLLNVQDMTILAFMRPILGNFDLRCITMPHQLEAYKMAQMSGIKMRPIVKAIIIAGVCGIFVAFFVALGFWHHFGAEVKTDAWRTSQGRTPFDNLSDLIRNRATMDWYGVGGVIFGFLFTAALMLLRYRFVWWPLHPVGYLVANTNTLRQIWLPFLIAWAAKSLIMRYGGAKLYRASQPFFLGLIAGDLVGGGFFTALGSFVRINIYPINW